MRVCEECRRCFDDSEAYCTDESHPDLSHMRNGGPEMISGYRFDLFLGSDIKGETFYAHNAAGGSCLVTIRSADEEYSRHFLTEAEIAAAFCHPNVVDIYEAGRLETGEVFVVSEDAGGRTLRQLLQAEGVPKILTSVQVVRQAAEALYALHTSGLTHGAINPENILLTIDAQNRLLVRIKDLDLGGVVTRSIISNKFHNDSALDSLRYFAPEHCSGSGTGPKADIYSLGVVLHEMLAGSPPFKASKAVGLIEQHRNQPPPEVKIDDIDLRMLLTHTLMEALRKQPEIRQASANAFARQMRHMEQLATHSSVPPPALTVPPVPPKHELDKNTVARPVPSANIPFAVVVEENSESAAIIIEPDRVSGVADEIEPAWTITANSVDNLREMVEDPADNTTAQTETVEQNGPRRSRLRSIKRRLRLGASRSSVTSASDAHDIQVISRNSIDEPIAQTAAAQEQMVEAKEPRRSRLRELKRKLRSMAPNILQTKSVEPHPITEMIVPSKARSTETRAVETIETAAAGVVSARTPRVVKWEQPDDDIPTRSDVVESLMQESGVVPVLDAAPKEIAYAPAYSSRISIDLEPPEVPVRFLPEENLLPNRPQKVVFLPSLGISAIRETLDDQSGPMFSAFYGQSSSGHRWKMVGGGIVMLAALFFVGRIATRDFAPADSESTPPVTAAGGTSPIRIEQPVSVSPASPTTVKNVRSSPPKEPEVAQAKPLPSKDDQPPSTERTRKSVVDASLKRGTPYAALIGLNLGPTQPSMSTVVITYGNGKVTSRTESGKRSIDKKPAAALKKSTDPARPRVVKVPN